MQAVVRIDQLADRNDSVVARTSGRALQFVVALWEQFRQDSLLMRASGLAYSSLLALVPLTVVVFAIFSAFGGLDEIKDRLQEFLLGQMLPASQVQVAEYLNQFTGNARELGFFGFLFLVATSVFLLEGIESNFNDIWHVRHRRSLVSRITAYTSALIFGSLLLGASLSISARIKATLFTGIPVEMDVLSRLANLALPLALSILGILALSLIVPDTRVRLPFAVIGAVTSGILFEIGKHIFALYAGRSVQYSTIYGSLAIFPLFLVWLYITWVIVLLGIEITFVLQNFHTLVRSRQLRHEGGDGRVSLAVKFFLHIARCFDRGLPPPTLDQLASRFLVPSDRADLALRRLHRGGLVHELVEPEQGLAPARPLDHLPLTEMIATTVGATPFTSGEPGSVESLAAELLERFTVAGFDALGDYTVGDLMRTEDHAEPVDDPADDLPLHEVS